MPEEIKIKRAFHFYVGSLPLCKIAHEGKPKEMGDEFRVLPAKVQDRLESLANVHIIKGGAKMDEFGLRLPQKWTPVGDENRFESGLWAFPVFSKPLLFTFHLPTKLQSSIFPSLTDGARAEDFAVAYDGMIFVAVVDKLGEFDWWSTGPTIRKYLQRELLTKVSDFVPAIIPPSPMHLKFDFLTCELPESAQRPKSKFESDFLRFTVYGSDSKELTAAALLEDFFYEIVPIMRNFYYLMIDRSIAEDVQRGILKTSRIAYEKYGSLLATAAWKLTDRIRLTGEISKLIGETHQGFCDYSLKLAEFREAKSDFLGRVNAHALIGKAEEYFAQRATLGDIDYKVFEGSLAHMRSHMLVLVQNRNLVYAALAGSAVTLLGTVVGFLLAR